MRSTLFQASETLHPRWDMPSQVARVKGASRPRTRLPAPISRMKASENLVAQNTCGQSISPLEPARTEAVPSFPQPEQRHAGKVGLGPHISTGDSLTDKIKNILPGSHHKTHDEHVGRMLAI